jgi:MFS transporter, ACS family, tartrate transporter
LFIVEAVPALVLGVVVFFYMTDRPEKASWLKDDERAWLVSVMNQEASTNKTASANHNFIRGLADARVIALSLIYFGTSAGLYTLGIWAPQIIKQMNVSSMTVGLLNAIPPSVSVVAMVLWSRHSDRTGERAWHVIIACLVAATGLVIAGPAQSLVGLIAALTLVNIGISCAKPPLWTMPTTFLSGAAAAAGIATINSIGTMKSLTRNRMRSMAGVPKSRPVCFDRAGYSGTLERGR